MKFNNQQIYDYATALVSLKQNHNLYIPVKANFVLQKNINAMIAAAQDIESARLGIARHYGTLDQEQGQYLIPEDKAAAAGKELQDLFSLEQEINIRQFALDDLGNAEFTPAQMQAIMFMISEEE